MVNDEKFKKSIKKKISVQISIATKLRAFRAQAIVRGKLNNTTSAALPKKPKKVYVNIKV